VRNNPVGSFVTGVPAEATVIIIIIIIRPRKTHKKETNEAGCDLIKVTVFQALLFGFRPIPNHLPQRLK